jgi:hypothetical protein
MGRWIVSGSPLKLYERVPAGRLYCHTKYGYTECFSAFQRRIFGSFEYNVDMIGDDTSCVFFLHDCFYGRIIEYIQIFSRHSFSQSVLTMLCEQQYPGFETCRAVLSNAYGEHCMAYNLFVNDNNRKRKGDINSIDKEACSCLDLLL